MSCWKAVQPQILQGLSQAELELGRPMVFPQQFGSDNILWLLVALRVPKNAINGAKGQKERTEQNRYFNEAQDFSYRNGRAPETVQSGGISTAST